MTIHWCGTGLSAIPGLRALLQEGREVCVWNRTPEKARAALGELTDWIEPFQLGTLQEALNPGDIVVSMLPAEWHLPLARACLAEGAHFITSSYIAPEMRALDAAAQDKDLRFVNEVGLDPGIDHLMAHWLVADMRAGGHARPGAEYSATSSAGRRWACCARCARPRARSGTSRCSRCTARGRPCAATRRRSTRRRPSRSTPTATACRSWRNTASRRAGACATSCAARCG
jgi:hypothetical protein